MTDQDPYYEIKKKFHQTFYKNLYPYLQSLEDNRIKTCNNLIITAIIIAIITVVLIIETGKLNILIFGFIAFMVVYTIFQKKFEYEIKQKIMPQICGCFEDLTWEKGRESINEDIFYDSALTNYYNRSSFDDIFSGSYKDTDFQIIETDLRHEKSTEKNTSSTTVFSGVVIDIKMNKNFNSHTIIRPDSLFHASPNLKLKRTELEDVVFEKKYDVYTNDEVEARYLITTSFMERLNNIEKIFKTSSACCAFYKGRLLIGLSTKKDMFCAAKLNKTLKDTGEISVMFDEIISIYKLIDYLKLEQKIGL